MLIDFKCNSTQSLWNNKSRGEEGKGGISGISARRGAVRRGDSPQPLRAGLVPAAPRAGAAGTSAHHKDERYAASLRKVGAIPLEGAFRSRRFTANTKGPANPHKLWEREGITEEMGRRAEVRQRSRGWPGDARAGESRASPGTATAQPGHTPQPTPIRGQGCQMKKEGVAGLGEGLAQQGPASDAGSALSFIRGFACSHTLLGPVAWCHDRMQNAVVQGAAKRHVFRGALRALTA